MSILQNKYIAFASHRSFVFTSQIHRPLDEDISSAIIGPHTGPTCNCIGRIVLRFFISRPARIAAGPSGTSTAKGNQMTPAAHWMLSAVLAYLVGSIPCSLLLARWGKGIDLRQHGSGNVGATNVARTMGWRWGISALLLDVSKGSMSALLVPQLFPLDSAHTLHQQVLCGILAVLGHTFSCWLKFQGGKGVATGLGVALILSWQASVIALVVFAVTFAARRIVSLASIVSACSFTLFVLYLSWPDSFSSQNLSLSAFAISIPGLIVLRHTSNITRILRGEENPLTLQTPAPK